MTDGTGDRSEDLFFVYAVAACVPMAVDAPAHAEIGDLTHLFHGFDGSVTGLASDAFGDVRTMVEAREIRKSLNAHPGDWF